MKNWQKISLILLGIVGLHLFLLIQLQFTAWPEMLLWPYLWLHNVLPYKDVAIVHTPILLAKLAIFYKLFGVGILQLKIFTWALILFTDILIFWIVKKLWNIQVATVAVISFVFWQLFFEGNGLWFDLVLAPLSIITFYLIRSQKYIWAGIFWAVMFFTKQTAVWFLLPIFFEVIVIKKKKICSFVKFVVGGLIILGISLLSLFALHLLPYFYNWAINFGLFVLPRAQGQVQLPDFKALVVASMPFAIFVAFLFNKKTRNINILLWAVAGSLGAYPRFEYFHFQPAIPFLALAIGIVLTSSKNKLTKTFITIYILGSLYLFSGFIIGTWGEGTRFYETNVTDVTSFVISHTQNNDKIFVMNWWDNIYALTGTLPATDPWVPQLSWYQEVPGIQEKEVSDLEKSKPKLILLQDYTESGLSSYKPQKVFDYVMANYKLEDSVDGIEVFMPKN